MTVETSVSRPIDSNVVRSYFDSLVNRFFKILPMRENDEVSLGIYIRSLQCELLGCQHFVPAFHRSDAYVSLLAILQFLKDTPDCPLSDVRREVFKAISICNKLKVSLEEEQGQAEVHD